MSCQLCCTLNKGLLALRMHDGTDYEQNANVTNCDSKLELCQNDITGDISHDLLFDDFGDFENSPISAAFRNTSFSFVSLSCDFSID